MQGVSARMAVDEKEQHHSVYAVASGTGPVKNKPVPYVGKKLRARKYRKVVDKERRPVSHEAYNPVVMIKRGADPALEKYAAIK